MKLKINSGSKIKGTIDISGAKNAVLPIIACALLTKEEMVIKNVPLISDVLNMVRIIDYLGAKIEYDYQAKELTIEAKKLKSKIDTPYVKKLRASYYIMGALISRKKKIVSRYPGGCDLGKRPIDLHLKTWCSFGCKCFENSETLIIKRNTFKPTTITFPLVSVGASINAILTAVQIPGQTTINNIALEPEVYDVINCLKAMGAKIEFVDERSITIEGVKKLKGITYQVIFDRIEAGSYLLLGASVPHSEVTIQNVDSAYLNNTIEVLEHMGCVVNIEGTQITLISPDKLKGLNIETGPYPEFPTDLQPLLSTVLLRAEESSTIIDNIYPNRFSHILEINKLKGKAKVNNGELIIYHSLLKGGEVIARDLRCGFALILAGAMADGTTILHEGEILLRGYENLITKLQTLGLDIETTV